MLTMILIALGINLLLTAFLLFTRQRQDVTSLETQIKDIKEEFPKNREEYGKNLRETRVEMMQSLKSYEDSLLKRISEIASLQKNQLDIFAEQLKYLTTTTTQSLDKMTRTIEERLKAIQEDSSQKLEKMRETVDEKLHKTLEARLAESFRTVQTQLEQVHKGLGEMQNLATGVGDLKKVLSNVKTRGALGEIQLANIIEDILTPDQYEKNVKTKKESNELVEFAIKLPGNDEGPVYLPIDSKFPTENYVALLNAYDKGDITQMTISSKKLYEDIESFAKDIHDKYIDVPHTTEFAILFLPTEGLYAEIVKNTTLTQKIQNKYHVNISGPSTLASSLNGFRMGFRTLIIEKRSSEVWKILGAVKTEFKTFEGVLKNAQKKIQGVQTDIETLIGTRTNQIQRKLREVEELPTQETTLLLEETNQKNDSSQATLI